MKKKLLKIVGTILAVVAFFIAQYHIRQYYDIDPRIWFFVVFGISFIGVVTIIAVFYSEINNMEEYFKTHSFSEFISEISKKLKPITEKIVNSFIFDLLSIITTMTAFTGIMYKFFFRDDFMARTILYIVFLVSNMLKKIYIVILEHKNKLCYYSITQL